MNDLQGEQWRYDRLGKITASRVKDVMAKTKSGYAASRTNYMMQLLCERLTGTWEEGYTSPAMLRGIEMEPLSISAYEVHTGNLVVPSGLVLHPVHQDIGASPDGLVGDDGLIECKNPNTAQHVACLQSGEPDKKYWWQMQSQMFCTGREWCDFVSFDDRLPDELQFFIARVERDEQAIDTMLDECLEFLGELEKLEIAMIEKMKEAA